MMNPFNAISLGSSSGNLEKPANTAEPATRAERGVFEVLFNQANGRQPGAKKEPTSPREGRGEGEPFATSDHQQFDQGEEWKPVDRMPPAEMAGARLLKEDSVKSLLETTRSEAKQPIQQEPTGKKPQPTESSENTIKKTKSVDSAEDTEELREAKDKPKKDTFTESAEAKKQAKAESGKKTEETDENVETEEEQALIKAHKKDSKNSKNIKIEHALKAAAMEKVSEKEAELENGTRNALNRVGMVMEAKIEAKATATSESAEELLTEEFHDSTAGDWTGQGKSGHEARDQQARSLALPAISQAAPTNATQSNPAPQFAQAPAAPSVLLEKVWQTVTTFQARGADNWVVQLRPDGDTRLELAIRHVPNGIEIAARMHKGDLKAVQGQWGELQVALAERGVQLKALEPGEAFKDWNRDNLEGKEAHRDGRRAFGESARQDGDADENQAPNGAPSAQPDNAKPTRRPRAAATVNGWEGWA